MESLAKIEIANNLNNVLTYRRAVGMADNPQAYLESEHSKRVARVHELNKTLLDGRTSATAGMIADRIRIEKDREDRCAYFAKAGNPIEKLQKVSAIAMLKMKGVKNPSQFVQILEETGSDLLFDFIRDENFSPWYETADIPSIRDIRYKDLPTYVDKYFELANIDRNLLKIGLQRMQLLGFKVDYAQEGIYRKGFGFLEYFDRVAQIPQDQFERNLQNLNFGGTGLDERSLGYGDLIDGEYKLKLSYGSEEILTALETGEVSLELKAKLSAASEISELTDGLVRIPIKYLEFWEVEDLSAISTLIEFELGSTGNDYQNPSSFYLDLNEKLRKDYVYGLSGKNIFPTFAKALIETNSYWFVFQTAYYSHSPEDWMYRGFSNGLHTTPTSLMERADRLNDLMSDPNYQILSTLLEYYHQNQIPITKYAEESWFDSFQKRSDLLNKVINRISNFSDDERRSAFAKLSLTFFTMFQDTLDDEVYQLLGSKPEEFTAYTRAMLGILCIKNGEIDPELVASVPDKTKLTQEMLNRYIESQPELSIKFQALQKESQTPEWADSIPDPDLFWRENTAWFVAMNSKGIIPSNLQMFRRLNSNPNVREMLQSQDFTHDIFVNLQGKIGLNEQNITYLDKQTLLYVNQSISGYENRSKFFRGLLSMHPREFSGAISCLSDSNGRIDIDNSESQRLINQAINEIGAITPLVLREYVNEPDVIKRTAFVDNLKNAKLQLLTDKPIRNIFAEQANGDELLAELITMSFPGNEYGTVRLELGRLLDRNDDLEGIFSKPEGYESKSTAKARMAFLKDDEVIDRELLDYLKKLIPNPVSITKNREVFTQEFGKALVKLIKGAGSYQLSDLRSELPVMFSVLAREAEVRDVRKAVIDQSQVNTVTQFLGRVSEVVGVYFKDNFSARLEDYLKEYPDVKKHLDELLNEQRLSQIDKNLVKIPDQDLAALKPAIQRLKDNVTQKTVSNEKDVALVISTIVGNRVLGGKGGLRSIVKKEMGKFGFKEAEGNVVDEEEKPFKGVVSKNVASYFAKRTSGLCTAADIDLFNRPDHFHINLVRENTIIGNIQGYMIEYNGKRSFLFRGLNPSSSVVNHSNAEYYCEGMINIIKQFAKDNNMDEVYLSEQLGGWHALTNRVGEGVIDYVGPKYLTKENEVDFSYPITSTQRISKMYRIKVEV